MKTYEVESRMRNRDFMNVCRSLLSDRRLSFPSAGELVRKAVSTTAPRFYVSYPTALRVLRDMRRGRRSRWNSREITAQWHTLNGIVLDLERRKKMDFSRALLTALTDCKAPKFYMEHSTALRVFENEFHKTAIS